MEALNLAIILSLIVLQISSDLNSSQIRNEHDDELIVINRSLGINCAEQSNRNNCAECEQGYVKNIEGKCVLDNNKFNENITFDCVHFEEMGNALASKPSNLMFKYRVRTCGDNKNDEYIPYINDKYQQLIEEKDGKQFYLKNIEWKFNILNNPQNFKLSITIVIDLSVGVRQYYDNLKTQIIQYLDTIAYEYVSVSIVGFAGQVRQYCQWTSDKQQLISILDNIGNGDYPGDKMSTNIYGALKLALEQSDLYKFTGNDKMSETVVILQTDGADTSGLVTDNEIINIVQNSYSKVYTIFFGDEDNKIYSKQLIPLSTGGGPQYIDRDNIIDGFNAAQNSLLEKSMSTYTCGMCVPGRNDTRCLIVQLLGQTKGIALKLCYNTTGFHAGCDLSNVIDPCQILKDTDIIKAQFSCNDKYGFKFNSKIAMSLGQHNTRTGFLFDPAESNILSNETVTLRIHRLYNDTRQKVLIDHENPELTYMTAKLILPTNNTEDQYDNDITYKLPSDKKSYIKVFPHSSCVVNNLKCEVHISVGDIKYNIPLTPDDPNPVITYNLDYKPCLIDNSLVKILSVILVMVLAILFLAFAIIYVIQNDHWTNKFRKLKDNFKDKMKNRK